MTSLSPLEILQSVLPMYGLIILGGGLRRWQIIHQEADKSMMRLMINCLYPCLIIDKIIASEAVKDPALALWTLPTGFLIIAIGLILARFTGQVVGIPEGPERNTFATTCGIQNYGFAAVPIVMALFPPDLLGVLFVHSLGVELALWTLGISFLQGKIPTNFQSLLSAPVLAVIIGLSLTYSGIGDFAQSTPALSAPLTLMNWLGACSFPIALILVGAMLSDELRSCIPTIRISLGSLIVRILLMPSILLGLILAIPFPRELALILVVQAAMPSAVMPIVLSRLYGGSPAVAGQVVIFTQTLGVVTIPIWITIGLRLLGT